MNPREIDRVSGELYNSKKIFSFFIFLFSSNLRQMFWEDIFYLFNWKLKKKIRFNIFEFKCLFEQADLARMNNFFFSRTFFLIVFQKKKKRLELKNKQLNATIYFYPAFYRFQHYIEHFLNFRLCKKEEIISKM